VPLDPCIRDPDPRWKKSKSGTGTGMNIPDPVFLFLQLKMLKFFDAYSDPGSAMEKFGSGIRYKHPGYATLAQRINKTRHVN
jgi:hypothetical protein